ncbi:MAG: hypothetical protein ACI8RZ_007501 [Myxococcota bacterium]|jgi:hypothetical protein
MASRKKTPDPKRAAAIKAGLERRRARGGKLGRAFRYTAEQVAEVVRLRDEGLSWGEISSALSLPVSTARTLYLRGVADLSDAPGAGVVSNHAVVIGAKHAAIDCGMSDAAIMSLSSLDLDQHDGAEQHEPEADLPQPDDALLSTILAYDPRLGHPEYLERTRRLLSQMFHFPNDSNAEARLAESPDPRQRVWTLAEINTVRALLADGLAQLKIAKTVNASPNDISAIKQDRIDRVRGGYIVHRTKAKMKRYRAAASG